jgi:hypothetical protein
MRGKFKFMSELKPDPKREDPFLDHKIKEIDREFDLAFPALRVAEEIEKAKEWEMFEEESAPYSLMLEERAKMEERKKHYAIAFALISEKLKNGNFREFMNLGFLKGFFTEQAGAILKVPNPNLEEVLRIKCCLSAVLDLIEVYGLSLDTKLDKVLEVMSNRLKDMDQGLSNRD